ncbi:T9SS type A sorting domain-containing protein [Bacteroidales bacterium]|nr:T9SS type A sorting domain-containing protein [Bacteroidales bacterium]
MSKIFDQNNIDRFFGNFKKVKVNYDLEKVHQLINNPNAKATQRVRKNYKPFKIIIMTTSAIIIGAVASLFWFSGDGRSNEIANNPNEKHIISALDTIPAKETDADKNKKTKDLHTLSKSVIEQNVEPDTIHVIKKNQQAPNQQQVITPPDTTKENTQKLLSIKGSDKYSTNDFISNWPTDTIIDKKDLLVELNYQELRKFKIFTDGSYLFYQHIRPNGNKTTETVNINEIPNSDQIISTDPFRKMFTTTIHCETYSDFSRKRLHKSIDTLVPIIIERKGIQDIWWFNPHPMLFKQLPERYKHLENTYNNLKLLKRLYPSTSFTNFISNTPRCEPLNSLALSVEELINIGINVVDSCIIMQSKNRKFSSISSNGRGKSEVIKSKLNDLDIVRISRNDFPIFKTNDEGYRHIRPGRRSPFFNGKIPDDINTIIPVKIDVGKLKGVKSKIEYWWFKTSDEFIAALPDSIQNQLRTERDIILGDLPKTASKSCTYFEACKSTLDVVNLMVYPNPASTQVTITFSMDNEINGNIQLLNISGQPIKTLVSQTSFKQGENEFNTVVNGVPPGIYLISIITEQGFKTQRLIISN